MQCFGRCSGTAVRDEPEAAVGPKHLGAAPHKAAADDVIAADKASLKAKLRSSSSSKKQAAAAGEPYLNERYSASGVDRLELFRQYTQQHGRHIMAVSTLQQNDLDYFVLPGGSGHFVDS